MLIPLGFLAGSGGVEGDFELIETAIVSGTSTSAVTFSSLGTYSSTYKHLQVRMAVRTNRTSFSTDFLKLTFNADTATNYSSHILYGNGSSVLSEASASAAHIALQRYGSGATENYFGASVLDILDAYSTTKYKTIRNLGGASGSGQQIGLDSGSWRNTASLTSLTITVGGGTLLVAGSRFSLYGIKG